MTLQKFLMGFALVFSFLFGLFALINFVILLWMWWSYGLPPFDERGMFFDHLFGTGTAVMAGMFCTALFSEALA